ncbi:MAG: glycerol-3-phosphate dehydrogenase [Prochloraceae cyanobacterium]|nr:glycerol-3-phosphate dehydrogenase [Prochloraceae cyanobacterium]
MRDLTAIENQDYDLIVIGGGINGAGVARDAALRGLKTILLEKGDFAGGSSSWSSRLIHGGLRYLEYFEFPLVRESLKEREVLLRTAPHLVNPLLLTIPIYGDRSRPYWKIWAGMILYDIFSFDKTLPLHRMLPKAQFRQLFRSIDPEGLSGGAQYYDGQVAYAERLCLENIISAREAGAVVLNYTEVTHLQRQGDRLTSLVCRDLLTDKEFTVKGHNKTVVINTSGPWVDKVCKSGVENDRDAPIGKTRKIGPTKGSHIIVPPFPGAPETTFYVEAKSDGRPFFIIPWLNMYLIGTTDLRYNGDLDRIKADDEEIDYLLKETNNIIPTANLCREDVKFTYSGVRPLPNQEGKKPGSVTRKHILYDHKKEGVVNLISLIGGKLTTYRNVGEEMVDAVYRKMNKAAPPCSTDSQPLPGSILPSDRSVGEAIDKYSERIPLKSINHLFSMYGSRALEVLALINNEPELAEKITDRLPDIKAQIVYAVRSEFAYTLVDIARRRTTLAIHAGNYGLELLPVMTETLKKYCGWTQEKCDRASLEYRTYMEENCIPDYELTTS